MLTCVFISLQMLELSRWEKIAIGVMRQGHVPEHIAFIMDGNRRFGTHRLDKAMSGHQEGAFILKKCLLYCLQLGVKYASFYAFSLQNFKRGEKEVNFLMNLAREEFQQLSEIYEKDNIVGLVQKNNVRVVVAGDLDGHLKDAFPDVRQGFLKIQQRTSSNSKMTMYLCFAYDSIHEYNLAVSQAEKEGEQGRQAVFDRLMVPREVDILVRTSGECRLSNFLLMQVGYGMIYIEKNLWPAFNLFTLAKILLQYNFYYPDIQCKRAQTHEHKQ